MRRAGLCVLSLVLAVMAPADPLGAGAQAPTPAPPPSANSCIPPGPGPDWICQDGGWLPLGHPSIRSSVDPPPPPPPPPPPSANSCIPPVPGPDWVCQDGGWLPLGHPSIRPSGETPPPPPPRRHRRQLQLGGRRSVARHRIRSPDFSGSLACASTAPGSPSDIRWPPTISDVRWPSIIRERTR